jgi:hypothetical protein
MGVGSDDGANRDLGIEIEDEAAVRTYEPLGIRRLQKPSLERTAAAGTIPVFEYVVVNMSRRLSHAP